MNKDETLPDRLRLAAFKVTSRLKKLQRNVTKLDETAVRTAYARWAPYYDLVFRAPFHWGRQAAVKRINALSGHVLEAGVGTGMSLPHYGKHLQITGIDLSEEMLDRARARAEGRALDNIEELTSMDAGALTFPDDHFDVAVAMYVMPVVPDPVQVLRELERVTKPGGTVLLVNHFSSATGLRAMAEQKLERFASRLGWNTDFPKSKVLNRCDLELIDQEVLPPFGLFTLMSFKKPAATPKSEDFTQGE